MICEHLRPLEIDILSAGLKEIYRGQPWSLNCREWVYFDGYLDTEGLVAKRTLPSVVRVHEHRGTHDGEERGFVCDQCHDGLMGLYEPRPTRPTFRG